MRNTLARLALGSLLAGTMALLAACNTVKGFGEDIYSVGDASQRALSDAFYSDDGLWGADEVCRADAQAHGLPPGIYQALLPTAAESAMSRFDLTGPTWVRTDGIAVTEVTAQMGAAAERNAPIALGPDGQSPPPDPVAQAVHTGGASAAAPGTHTCADWSAEGAGSPGMLAIPGSSAAAWLAAA